MHSFAPCFPQFYRTNLAQFSNGFCTVLQKLSLHSLATGIVQFCTTTFALLQPVLYSFFYKTNCWQLVWNIFWHSPILQLVFHNVQRHFSSNLVSNFFRVLKLILNSFPIALEPFHVSVSTVLQQGLHCFAKGFSHFYTSCFAHFLNRISLFFVDNFGHFSTFFKRFCTFCIFKI